jgi:ElaB/YqjD/DUF883 family membrane-anchored ribosome-binding protein
MLGLSRHSRTNEVDLERRLQSIEQLLRREGGRVSARAGTSTDQIGEAVASVLSNIAERFRGSAGSMSDEASKFGSDAAALGIDALRRLSKEVAQRPLFLLGVAVAVGLLVGLTGHRR